MWLRQSNFNVVHIRHQHFDQHHIRECKIYIDGRQPQWTRSEWSDGDRMEMRWQWVRRGHCSGNGNSMPRALMGRRRERHWQRWTLVRSGVKCCHVDRWGIKHWRMLGWQMHQIRPVRRQCNKIIYKYLAFESLSHARTTNQHLLCAIGRRLKKYWYLLFTASFRNTSKTAHEIFSISFQHSR
jgi:hypothetical protein